jgi:hypothetical protein
MNATEPSERFCPISAGFPRLSRVGWFLRVASRQVDADVVNGTTEVKRRTPVSRAEVP